jgi:hypothetical protein
LILSGTRFGCSIGSQVRLADEVFSKFRYGDGGIIFKADFWAIFCGFVLA